MHMFLKDLNRKLSLSNIFFLFFFFFCAILLKSSFPWPFALDKQVFSKGKLSVAKLYVSLSAFSCLKISEFSACRKLGGFCVLCLPWQVFSFPRPLAQLGVGLGGLACKDSWLVLCCRGLCGCF